MSESYRALTEALTNSCGLLIVGHEDPDGDCLSTMLALYHAFQGQSRSWQMLMRDSIPHNLHYLPGIEQIQSPEQADVQADAVLMVDCGEPRRVGEWLSPLLPGKRLYCLDHHASNAFHGDLAVVEPQAAAAAEIAAALIFAAGLTPNDATALCLYSGIAADTACFRYQNTTPRCLELASRLLPQVDSELVRVQLFEARTWANMRMMAVCFQNMRVECDGKLCYTWVSNAEREQYQAGPADCHNIVNYTLVLAGVRMGLMFEEYPGYVKMSFRSRRGMAVDGLAVSLGGGGHVQASGAKLNCSLAEAMPIVLAKARSLFESEPISHP